MGVGVKYDPAATRRLLKERGWTVADLAGLALIGYGSLAQWQAGNGHPSLAQLQALAEALRVPARLLVAVEAFDGPTRQRPGARNWRNRAEIDQELAPAPAPEPARPTQAQRWAAQAARRKATLASQRLAKGADTPEKGQNGPSERL